MLEDEALDEVGRLEVEEGALLHQRLVSSRTHADRAVLDLTQPALERLTDKERKRLAKLFDDIRNDRKPGERRAELARMILGWCGDDVGA